MDRISTSMFFGRGVSGILQRQVELSRTELQLATGKRILTSKDDPAGSAYLLDIQSIISRVEQFQRNGDRLTSRLQLEDSTLQGMTDKMPRIIELTIQGLNDTMTAEDRQAIAVELRQLNEEMLSLANTKDSNGEYIFAGLTAGEPPFHNTGDGVYTYTGDLGSRSLQIANDRTVQDRDNGFDLFMNIGIWSPTTLTSIPATDFTAVDAGDITLDSVNGAGPVSLGALPTAADAEERAAQLLDAINQVADQTGISAELTSSTTLTLTSDSEKDISIGLTGTATTATTGMTAGVYSSVPQSRNLFETIHEMIAGLEANAPDENLLTDLQQAQGHLLDVRASVGGRLNGVESRLTVNEDFLLSMQAAKSKVEDLDYAEAIGRYEQQLIALQAAQQAFSKVQGLSLFNYL